MSTFNYKSLNTIVNAMAVVRGSLQKSGEIRLGSRQRERHRELATEKRCSHPNEMRDDVEVIGHVPKLMANWLTKFLKRATNSSKALIRGKRVNRGGGRLWAGKSMRISFYRR